MTKFTAYGFLLSSALLCKVVSALPCSAGDRRSLDIDILPREDLEGGYTRELYDDLDERSLFSVAAGIARHAAHSKHKHSKGHSIHISGGSSNDNNNEDRREYIAGQVEERSPLDWMNLDDLD